jgi:thiamine biosynthesis lipoprotein
MVSVMVPTATEADALSTAFSVMPMSQIADIVATRPNVQARITASGGTLTVYGA